MKFETRALHIGEEPNLSEGGSGDVVSPIHLTSTFARNKIDEPPKGYEYSRSANPTRDALEKRLASLENGKYGIAFASGLAATATVILSLMKAGDHMIAFDDLYGGTRRLFTMLFKENFNIDVSYVDARKAENIADAVKGKTRLIWLETPTNPLLKMCDIRSIASIAWDKKIFLAVDNTFMTPYFQLPLDLGADLVVHSTTKYLNGHSDSVGGAVVTSDDHIHDKIRFNQNAAGAILSPFDSYMILRGTKTLSLRMERHEKNALAIARYLENHDKIERVFYPGLESHPQHQLAKKQMSGYGGMVSFELKTDLERARAFVEGLKLFTLAESLGCVESLVELPALMTHSSIPPEEREKTGIKDSLIRTSVGIENIDDLLDDLTQSLKAI
ncbi:MAG: aminotransferase class I/II-fold pyridoxal phosphate-dependent enzyme [candidate division Zixibacteria bacterium]|nr:aminotransferase class I/II-fold pyridoxal phosphate-dependent enzyme [candidate division Zixibacteria bacterium]NIR68307.1 aminotransferase class I/II-fold pyridoxal phosphate-dependent enzyme [candidate division Zixibacteria bacterium]NIS18281.1 aminotransferase class I/II-fold pyridoxal phosphate-dependent enzyme [candidate division Zixibacteria bacterium]NIS49473.1 aminotransferase class I/II-fold pyridoxal phosphate-dependent enzyme [candidate division Zixibacteria bacterium]NIT54589.1 